MDIKQILKIGFLFYLLGFSGLLLAQDAQIVNAELTKDGTTKSICLVDDTEVDNIDVFDDEMIIKRLPAEQSGFLEFSVNQFSTSRVLVSLQEENDPTMVYPIEFDDGQVSINFGAFVAFAETDIFRISRCGGEISFDVNGQIIGIPITTGNFNEPLIAVVNVVDASGGADISLTYPNYVPHCVPDSQLPDNKEDFAVVKKSLDGSYFRIKNNELKFWYKERYAIANGQNNAIQYKVYDWQKNIEASGNLVNCYGPNWQQIDLVGVPNDNQFYVLELTGPNKGETYYVRFENYCDDTPEAPCNQ